MQGLNLKRILAMGPLATGPCYTSPPVSPLCYILDGCNTLFICKREELSLKSNRVKKCI